MKSFSRHLPHYLILYGIFFAGILGFWLFAYDRSFQILISIAVAISYVIWGVIYHLKHKDLNLSVVIEYLAVASLGLVVVFSLIFRT